MRQKTNFCSDREQGFATLAITMILLFLAALVAITTTITTTKEQVVSADHYRTEQSLNAAQAGMDWAIDYYNSTGLIDADEDGVIDLFSPGNPKQFTIDALAADPGALSVYTSAFFCDTREPEFWSDPENCALSPDLRNKDYGQYVGVVSVGESDDRTARRVITQNLGSFSPFHDGEGPLNPLTTHGGVDFTGNATIINRYHRDNIWSGETVTLGSSATVESFVADDSIPLGAEKFTATWRPAMIDPGQANTIPGVLPASSIKRGVNADVTNNDPMLNQLDNTNDDPTCVDAANKFINPPIDFMCAFFSVSNKGVFRTIAEDATPTQLYEADCSELNGAEGIVYWEGVECRLNGNLDAGTYDDPVFMFVDGDMFISGGTFYGTLYVNGDLEIAGNFIVYGSMLVRGDFAQKAGTGKFIYDPISVNPPDGYDGAKGPISKTWRDWRTNL